MSGVGGRIRAAAPAPGELDRNAVVLILLAIGTVIAIRYGGLSSTTDWLTTTLDGVALDGLSNRFERALGQSEHAGFNRRMYWGLFRWVVYVVPAVLVARFVLRTRLRDLGLKAGPELRRHAPLYLGLYLVLLPFVVAASFNGEFQDTYPFYEPPPGIDYWPRFYIWQAVYAGQFLALEFFFPRRAGPRPGPPFRRHGRVCRPHPLRDDPPDQAPSRSPRLHRRRHRPRLPKPKNRLRLPRGRPPLRRRVND